MPSNQTLLLFLYFFATAALFIEIIKWPWPNGILFLFDYSEVKIKVLGLSPPD